MKTEKIQSIISELLTALSAVIISFNLFNDVQTSVIVGLAGSASMFLWALFTKRSAYIPSLSRKLIQNVSPVLVVFNLVTPEQSLSITALLLVAVSTWTLLEQKPTKTK